MKYLTILLLFVSFTLNAQSLSETTGETKSLYNAICIHNDITPGDIGMKEFRKLAGEYAEEVGCTSDYELYLHNGGNNLFILYFNPAKKSEYKQPESFWGEDQEYTQSECNCSTHNAVDRAYIIDSVLAANTGRIDTVVHEVVIHSVKVIVDTVVVAKFDTVETIKSDEYCNCEDLDLNAAWVKYETLQAKYNEDVANHNGAINSACQAKLKRYMNKLQRHNYDEARNSRLEKKFDAELAHQIFESMHGEIEESKLGLKVRNLAPKRVKKSKKRRVRRLGKGHARTGNNSFWSKLFPFANC